MISDMGITEEKLSKSDSFKNESL